MTQLCGEDHFFWAWDFPHPDHTGDYVDELEELAEKLPDSARAKILGPNVRNVYHCG
jgi:predicted TIM-barrel fold metal-dependent hydrolase